MLGMFIAAVIVALVLQSVLTIPVYYLLRKHVPRVLLAAGLFLIAISVGTYSGYRITANHLVRDAVEDVERRTGAPMGDGERVLFSAVIAHSVKNAAFVEGVKMALPGALVIGLLAFFRAGRRGRLK